MKADVLPCRVVARNTVQAPLTLGEPIPQVCKVPDVLRALNISRATFDRLMARGQLPLEELPKLDRCRRFTGKSVQGCQRGKWAAR